MNSDRSTCMADAATTTTEFGDSRRGFLGRVKTSTVLQGRLNGLSLMSIKCDTLKNIDSKEVFQNDFVQLKSRRAHTSSIKNRIFNVSGLFHNDF